MTGQLCPAATALDFLGDTWSVLIVRDLLWHGPQRVSSLDLRNRGIDGLATAARVAHLQANGLVEVSGTPIEPTDPLRDDPVMQLTALGRSAGPVIEALCTFGQPLMARQTLTTTMLRQLVATAALDRHREIDRLDQSGLVGLEIAGRAVTVVLAPAILRADPEGDEEALDAVVRGTQDVFVEVVSGMVSCDEAMARRELEVRGDRELVRTLFGLLRDPRARRSSVAARHR